MITHIIPLVNLSRQHQRIGEKINHALQSVIHDSAFISGKYVARFEEHFARYCGVRHCVGLSSGTDALEIAYAAIGIKKGDEVITVANTFFATIEPLLLIGAKPVFVDVDPDTHLIDVSKIAAKVTKKTKAIVPVHLFGQMADMKAIMKVARRFKLKVIEDCAQAHGALQHGKRAGAFGDIGTYSFYPGKNLGAFGDAGCIVTNNPKYAAFAEKFRDHGRSGKYTHDIAGANARMDGIQGAVLEVKLRRLNAWVAERRAIAKKYNALLPSTVKKPRELKWNKHSYHLYVIETDRRDALLNYLKSRGIEAGIHYPVPLHKQKACVKLGCRKSRLPVTECAARRVLSLPLFPEMKNGEVKSIVGTVIDFFSEV